MRRNTRLRSVAYGPGIAEVDTAAGRVRGIVRNGVYTYFGLKYADAERFEAPRPPASWTGVKDALLEGPQCPSIGVNQMPAGSNIQNQPEFFPADEHCQYLKLWTPSIDPEAKKPVMFWLHGGGGAFGSCLEYDGEEMAAFGDVVVIAHNHRHNCLGVMDLSAYGEAYKDTPNLLNLDTIAALKWVRENIRAFGGDPDNVTLFGHSGGGAQVVNLMQIAEADGLYHKAIIMAGTPPEPTIYPSDACAKRIAARTLELLGLSPDEVDQLKTLPYETLGTVATRAMREVTVQMGFMPSWSQPVNDFFPGGPAAAGLRPEIKNIPIFVGSAQAERNYNLRLWMDDPIFDGNCHLWTDEHKEQAMRLWFGEKYDAVVEAYPKAFPGHAVVEALLTDMGHRGGSRQLVDLRSAQDGAPIYMYQFNYTLPINGGMVPWHGAELDFVFHRADYSEAVFISEEETARVQDEMCACWAAFARSGSPNHPGVPELPASTAGNYHTIIWDKGETVVRHNHDVPMIGLLPALVIPGSDRAFSNG